MARGRVFVLLVSLLRVIVPYKGCRRSLHFSSSFILTDYCSFWVEIIRPGAKHFGALYEVAAQACADMQKGGMAVLLIAVSAEQLQTCFRPAA